MENLTLGTEPNLFRTSRAKNLFWRAKSFWHQDIVRKYQRLLICGISCSHALNIHGYLAICFPSLNLTFHAGSIAVCTPFFTNSGGISVYFYCCLKIPMMKSSFICSFLGKLCGDLYFSVWVCASAQRCWGNLQLEELIYFIHFSKLAIGNCWRLWTLKQ